MNEIEKPYILTVDDRPENLLALETVLEGIPLNIVKAASGKEALWKLLEYDFALIVLDVQMPEMDGFETAEVIRGREKTKSIPIIFVTAINKEQRHIFKGYEVGAVDYLFKPIEAEILKSKVLVFLELYRQKKLINNQAEALQESEEMFRAISSSAQDGIVMLDDERRISYWNKSAERIFGYKAYEVFGQKTLCLIPYQYHHSFLERFHHFKTTGEEEVIGKVVEFTAFKNNGTEFPIEFALSAINIKNKWCAVFMIRDITERKLNEKRLEYMANFDTLTGLPNRKMFFDSLKRALSLAKRNNYLVALLFIDLDRFKTINDTHGHETGDLLLIEAGKRMEKSIRASDIVTRMGGDEFTVLLTKIEKPETAATAAQRITEEFNKPFKLGNKECFVGASIGISVYPYDCDNAHTLVANADKAMYCAKKACQNSFQLYSPELNLNANERLKMENELKKAITHNDLIVYYHPQIDINTGQIIGLEALVRWQHPELGLISPGEFIPLAEETGLILQIDALVMRAACRQFKEWEKKGVHCLRLGVNFSGHWFKQIDKIKEVKEILQETGMDPRFFDLELTESIFMENSGPTIAVMKDLRSMGIQLSIDDFGTGYSSLAYLNRLPISRLKIDRSFISNITKNSSDKAIVAAIITMAHSMNLKVIAEGVETSEQLELLRSLHCEEIQGFLISKPLPADEVLQIVSRSPFPLSTVSV